jgi:hypothetical protein
VRRAAAREEGRYRRWRRGLPAARRRRLPARRPNILFVMVDSLSAAQVPPVLLLLLLLLLLLC